VLVCRRAGRFVLKPEIGPTTGWLYYDICRPTATPGRLWSLQHEVGRNRRVHMPMDKHMHRC